MPFKLKNTGRNNTAKIAGKEKRSESEKCFIDALQDVAQSQFASMKGLLPQSNHTPSLRWQLSSAEGGVQVVTFLSTQSTSVYGSLKRNCCRDQLYMDLGRDSHVGSNTRSVWAAFEGEGDAARRYCTALMWDFDRHCRFCAASLENHSAADPLLDVRGLYMEAVCLRSAFFQNGLENRMDKPEGGFGSYPPFACRGKIDSSYC